MTDRASSSIGRVAASRIPYEGFLVVQGRLLSHSLTGESCSLDALGLLVGIHLRVTPSGRGVIVGGAQPLLASQFLQRRVLDDGATFFEEDADGRRVKHDHVVESVQFVRVQEPWCGSVLEFDLRLWCVRKRVPGLRLWWELPAIHQQWWPQYATSRIADKCTRRWEEWQRWFTDVLPSSLCMQRGLQVARRHASSPARVTVDPSASSIGLIVFLAEATARVRKADDGSIVSSVSAVCNKYFNHRCISLPLVLSEEHVRAFHVLGAEVPPGLATTS